MYPATFYIVYNLIYNINPAKFLYVARLQSQLYYAMIRKTSLILLLLTTLQLSVDGQQTGQLDVKKSKILWNTGKLVGGHYGYFYFNSGSLQFSGAGEPVDGSFNMDMKSIRSTDHALEADNQKTDQTLQTEKFLDIGHYPVARMIVKKISRIDNSTNYKVNGDLTIKGITNPIEFIASIITTDNTTKVIAEVDIHRFKWSIDVPAKSNSLDFLSGITEKAVPDEVHLSLTLLFNK